MFKKIFGSELLGTLANVAAIAVGGYAVYKLIEKGAEATGVKKEGEGISLFSDKSSAFLPGGSSSYETYLQSGGRVVSAPKDSLSKTEVESALAKDYASQWLAQKSPTQAVRDETKPPVQEAAVAPKLPSDPDWYLKMIYGSNYAAKASVKAGHV